MSTSNNCRVTLRGQGSGNRQEPSNTSRLSQVGPAGPFATAFGSPSGTHPPTDLYDQFPNLPNQPRVPNGPNLSTLANLPNLPNLPTLPNLPQQNSFSHDVVFLLSSHSSKALEAARSKKQDQPGRPAHASQCQCANTGSSTCVVFPCFRHNSNAPEAASRHPPDHRGRPPSGLRRPTPAHCR